MGSAAAVAIVGIGAGPADQIRRFFAARPVATSLPPCIVRPEQTEGPYFVDERLNRSDIRTDPSDGSLKPGVPFALTLRVHEIRGTDCRPLANAAVDIWHCDAAGVYSDVRDRSYFDTRGKKFLRGYQMTDSEGTARFQTIYPGWYPGRTVHVHFKIRTDPESRHGHEFTSQIYFEDSLSERIHSQPPYRPAARGRIRNRQDGIFRNGGRDLMLPLAPAGDGYAGTFEIGLIL